MPEFSIITCMLSQLDKFLECGFVTLGVLPRLHGNQTVVLFFGLFAPLSTMMDPSGVFNSADYSYISNAFVFCTRTHVIQQQLCGAIGGVTSYSATYPVHAVYTTLSQ